ncbi:MAG: LON peptidase substrate-binding domain-containing protein [Pseudomonadota bacterium]
MVRRFSSAADLPQTIPIFPLPGAVVLPRGRLPLNIFEPRYLAMVDDMLKTEHRLIGMIQPFEGEVKPSRLHTIGCAGRITSLSETEDGRYLLVLSGASRFRVIEEIEGFTPYRRVNASWDAFVGDLGEGESLADWDREAFLALLKRYFDVAKLSSDWDSLHDADSEMLINSLSTMCPFAVEEKQALLEAPQLIDRAETLSALMQFAIAEGDVPESGGLQ